MIAALDSAQPPTPDQAAQARAAGVRGWWGYIATAGQSGSAFNLLHVWTQADFDVVRRTFGAPPIAYGSGWDDPVALRQLADAWGVRLGLDLESGIRGDGPWTQPWLDASGAGLYGSCGVHYHQAAWHVLAWYPGFDPGSTWYGPCGTPPAGPVGLQWQGSHQEFGLDVDRGWYDDYFGGFLMALTDQQQQEVHDWVQHLTAEYDSFLHPGIVQFWTQQWGQISQILAAVQALQQPPAVDVPALATALATHPLTATLSDAERDAVATHVLQHLSKDTAAG